MTIPSHIFREYDIRGLADTELTDEVCRSVGHAFATVLQREGKKKVSLGHDLRKSSDRIHAALSQGLMAAGMQIFDLGLVPTPLVYFSVSHLKLDAGISITGSHNPPEYNGFKLHLKDRPVFGSEIQKLKNMIEKKDFDSGKGTIQKTEIIEEYIRYVQGQFKFRKKLKVVIDAGHGMGGLVAPQLLKSFGHEVIELYTNLDPEFPDHHPDPTVPENLEDLQKEVLKSKADIGIGFDGDADRIGVVDEKGGILFGDKILLLYAREILKKNPGATIIGDVKCSKAVYDEIARLGGKPIMWKTGHSLIKAKLKENKAHFAGEMSGHMFFNDRWFGFDDAIYSACRMLEVLDHNPEPLSRHLASLPHLYSTPEIRVECPEEKKFEIVKRAIADFKKDHKVIDIDGARIEFEDGWGLVRASNTQPVLVMRFEAKSEKRLQEIQQLVESKVNELSGAL